LGVYEKWGGRDCTASKQKIEWAEHTAFGTNPPAYYN